MHISWSFLDKRGATTDALRAFNAMDFVLKHAPEKMSADENGLIAEIDVLQERYRQAVEFMAWFKPAWEQLSEDERLVLDLFYMSGECAVEQIMEHFHVVRKTAYNRKNDALDRLTCLLYGKA